MLNCRGADLEVLGESALCAGHLGANNGGEGEESRGEQTVMTEQMERKNSVSIPDNTRVGRPHTPAARHQPAAIARTIQPCCAEMKHSVS